MRFAAESMNYQFLVSIISCNIVALIIWLIAMAITKSFAKTHPGDLLPGRKKLVLPLFLYGATLLAITVIPLPFSSDKMPLHSEINYVPIVNTIGEIWRRIMYEKQVLLWDALENIYGNILMFIPLGIMLPLFHPFFKTRRNTIITGFASSFLIEFTQLASRLIHNYRHIDIDDVILNTSGAAIGFFIYQKWRQYKMKKIVVMRGEKAVA